MKAWNYIKNDCDQETGKEYSTILQIIMKDDRGKAIAWRSVSCKMTCYTYQTKKQYTFLVCILYPVCSLHFVPSLHIVPGLRSAVCILYWLDWYCCFCSSEPQVRTEILELEKYPSETILAAMLDMWTVCWRAHEEKYNDRAMITLYRLKTKANARLTNVATSNALSRGHSVCWNEPATGPLGVNISASRFKLHFQKFGNVIWGCYFYYTI